LIHFDIDSRYEDELVVGSAISRREGVIFSVVFHILLVLAIFLVPKLPMFQVSPEELAQRRADFERKLREQADQRFVFVQPRIDMKALQPPERAPLSDVDRRAQTRETPPTASNPAPFVRGNSREQVEQQSNERAAGEQNQNQPTLQPQPESQEARVLPPADEGFTITTDIFLSTDYADCSVNLCNLWMDLSFSPNSPIFSITASASDSRPIAIKTAAFVDRVEKSSCPMVAPRKGALIAFSAQTSASSRLILLSAQNCAAFCQF